MTSLFSVPSVTKKASVDPTVQARDLAIRRMATPKPMSSQTQNGIQIKSLTTPAPKPAIDPFSYMMNKPSNDLAGYQDHAVRALSYPSNQPKTSQPSSVPTSTYTPVTPQPFAVQNFEAPKIDMTKFAEPVKPSPAGGLKLGSTFAATAQPTRSPLESLREDYLKRLRPSDPERSVQREALEAEQQLDNLIASRELGVNNLEGQGRGIPLSLIRGQQQKLMEQAALQALPLEARIKRLQGEALLGQKARESEGDIFKAQLDFAGDDLTRQAESEKNLQAQMDKLGDNARQAFSTILSNFGGLDFDELDADSQFQLAEIGAQSGIPVGLLRSGLKTIKDQQLAQAAQKQADTQAQRDIQNQIALARLEISQANASGSNKPPSEGERRAFNFYSRAADANNSLEGVEDEVASLGFIGQTRLRKAPNFAQSQTGQLQKQAERQFIEAYLRKDSGAAIPPNEYDMARLTYFPQPGDTQETLTQKRGARETVLSALRTEAGRAYTQTYSDSPSNGGNETDINSLREKYNY